MPARPVSPLTSLLLLTVGATLAGCDGFGGTPVVADADGSRSGLPTPAPVPDTPVPNAPVPNAPSAAPVAPPVRSTVPQTDPRTVSPRPDPRQPAGDGRVPSGGRPPERNDGGRTDMPNRGLASTPPAGSGGFDRDVDPSTLTRPEPAAPPEQETERPPELQDYPLAAVIPPDRQAIPADLALPAGTVLAYHDGRDWVEVELKADAPPEGAPGATPLRVHRTDRPTVIPDVRIPRDQLVISKLLVRRLQSAR